MKRIVLCLSLLALAGCPEKKPNPTTGPAADAALVGDGAAMPVDSGAAASGAASWSGTYTLAPATLSIPSANKDYAGVKQAKDDPTKVMGEGTIELEVDGDGNVTGALDGAAGPAVLGGSIVDGEIRCTVRRKDPKDNGPSGTLTAKVAGNAAEGNLSLSVHNAELVREGKVSLKKK